MEQVRLGRTGLKVSRLGLGTMSMGSSAWKGWVLDPDRSVPILRRALEAGITFFDMADWYRGYPYGEAASTARRTAVLRASAGRGVGGLAPRTLITRFPRLMA